MLEVVVAREPMRHRGLIAAGQPPPAPPRVRGHPPSLACPSSGRPRRARRRATPVTWIPQKQTYVVEHIKCRKSARPVRRAGGGNVPMGFGLRPDAKAPDEPPSPTGYAPPPRLYPGLYRRHPRRAAGRRPQASTPARGGARTRSSVPTPRKASLLGVGTLGWAGCGRHRWVWVRSPLAGRRSDGPYERPATRSGPSRGRQHASRA